MNAEIDSLLQSSICVVLVYLISSYTPDALLHSAWKNSEYLMKYFFFSPHQNKAIVSFPFSGQCLITFFPSGYFFQANLCEKRHETLYCADPWNGC